MRESQESSSHKILKFDAKQVKKIQELVNANHADQRLVYNEIKLILNMMVKLKHSNDHLEIRAVKASSQDNDQSIFRTLVRNDNYFWSSTESLTPDANEYLIYSLPGRTMVYSVVITVYKQFSKLFSPRTLMIEVMDDF